MKILPGMQLLETIGDTDPSVDTLFGVSLLRFDTDTDLRSGLGERWSWTAVIR